MATQIDKPTKFEEPKGAAPTAPNVPLSFLPVQFWRDIFGKEVQSAATYSYLWMADQMGHLCIGILVQFIVVFVLGTSLLGWVIGEGHWVVQNANHIAAFIVVAGVSLWEFKAFSKSKREGSSGFFPLDVTLLRNNAIIATAYMVFGVIVGWGFIIGAYWGAVIFIAMLIASLACAPYWFRQKIIWQKASMPYLSRLADVTFQTKDTARLEALRATAKDLQAIIDSAPDGLGPKQVILAGPIGSGRTPIACGIGTELAFRESKVRFLSFDVLIELADQRGDAGPQGLPPIGSWGPKNIYYWPWFEAQALIIDDISPIIGTQTTAAGEDAFRDTLAGCLTPIQAELSERLTVWVFSVDDDGRSNHRTEQSIKDIDRFARNIQEFCGATEPPLIMLLPAADKRME